MSIREEIIEIAETLLEEYKDRLGAYEILWAQAGIMLGLPTYFGDDTPEELEEELKEGRDILNKIRGIDTP